MFKEFKEFAVKGNALELAIGVIIGAAFTSVVNSIVNDIFNPLLGIFIGKVDFHSWTLGLPGEGVLGIGSFINALINFLIVSIVVFLIARQFNRFRKKPSGVPDTKQCPYCMSAIALKATRCPNCTSQLNT
ncbi:MAG TPA: large conductance mechanosensitive channel protein MscL [Methylomirabilota bacterium]|jgi:large conductance mechanosensitive channel|nr:large conductance mechanosensitive channel protein MscL [Methylomirabilota bacterium]